MSCFSYQYPISEDSGFSPERMNMRYRAHLWLALPSLTWMLSLPTATFGQDEAQIRPSTAGNRSSNLQRIEPPALIAPPALITPPAATNPLTAASESQAASFAQPIIGANTNADNGEQDSIPNTFHSPSPTPDQDPQRIAPTPPSYTPVRAPTTSRGLASLGPMSITRDRTRSSSEKDVMVGRPSMGNWFPTPTRVGMDDIEANRRPTLTRTALSAGSSGQASFPDDESLQVPRFSNSMQPMNSVQPAGFMQRGFQQPPLQGSGSVLPGNPALTNQSVMPNMGQVLPNNSTIAPNNLPTYQPRVVTQEPFVTAPPCRFDGYNMLLPASYDPCAPAGLMPVGGAPLGGAPYTYTPPTVTPNMAPNLYAPNNSGWRPLFTLGQENYNAQLGRGIFGQPKAYVSGQPVRNFFRYIFP